MSYSSTRSVALVRVLASFALAGMTACADQNPLAPDVENEENLAPAIAASRLEAPLSFSAQNGSELLANCQVVSDVLATPSSWPICLVSRTTTQTRVRVTFEGVGNVAAPGNLGFADFPDWHGLIAKRTGGDGLTHNEPSGTSTLFWSRLAAARNPLPSDRNIEFLRPVHDAQLSFAAKLGCVSFRNCSHTPLTEITLKGISPADALLDSESRSANWNQGSTPDPSWSYNKWDPLFVESPPGAGGLEDNLIDRLNINGYEDLIGIDDLILTIINFRPVSLPGGPYSGPQGSPIQFDGDASYDPVDASGLPHPNGDAVTYLWDFGDGLTSTLADPQHAYLLHGTYTATLTVTDPNGLSHSSTTSVTVTNVAPVVTVRDTTVFVGQALQLPLTIADPGSLDGPWAYSIDFGDGTVKPGTITTWSDPMSPAAADRSHTYGDQGTYTVTVTASDSKGGTRTETRTITVPNRAPVAAFASGPTAANEGGSATYLQGSTDADGDPLTHAWVVKRTTSVTPLATGAGLSIAVTFPDNGTYTVELATSDGFTTSTITRTVTVANLPPTATLVAPPDGRVGQPLTLTLTSPADPGPDDIAAGFTYAFDCGSGFGTPGTSTTATCTPTLAGSLTVRGRVFDKDGGSAEYSASVPVVPANTAPTGGRLDGPATGNEGQSLAFSAADWTDPDPGQTLSYTWTLQRVSSGGWTTTATGAAINVVFPDEGSYEITLTVEDDGPDGGLSTTVMETVVISNIAPQATFAFPALGVAGTSFGVSLTYPTDPGVDDTLTYTFTCGGGAPASQIGATAVCLPTAPGSFTVTGTIADGDGGSTTYTGTVAVAAPNSPPAAGTIGVSTPAVEGSPVTLTAVGWSDPDEDALAFTWEIRSGSHAGPLLSSPGLSGSSIAFTFDDNGTYYVTLTAEDPSGATATHQQTVAIANVAPSATFAFPASATTGTAFPISLSSVSDPGDDTHTYVFTCGGGAPTSQSGPSATCTPMLAGNYAVTGTVTDDEGGTTTYVGTVTVSLTNGPPVPGIVTASAPALEGSLVTLATSGWTDPDADPLTFTWTIRTGSHAGPIISPAGLVGPSVGFTFADDATYYVTVTAEDAEAASATAQATVSVENVAPTAQLVAPATGIVGTAFSISFTNVVDPGVDDALTYNFACDGGAPQSSSGSSATCLPATEGGYIVTGTVADGDGGSSVYSATVAVAPLNANDAPVPGTIVGDALAPEGFTVTFTQSGWSDPEGDPISFTWSITGPESVTGTGPSITHPFVTSGSYTVSLTASDGQAQTTITSGLTILPVAPTVTAGPDQTISSGSAFDFAATYSDPDPTDGPWQWEIAWGDGRTTSGTSASQNGSISTTQSFLTPGTYTVVCTVTDADGKTGSDTVLLTVGPIAAPIWITPRTIKLRNNGNGTVTVRVTSSAGFDHSTLTPGTLRLTSKNGAGIPVRKKNNGAYDYVINPAFAQFKFSLDEFMAAENIPTGSAVPLYLVGTLPDGRSFEGFDRVVVLPR